MTTLSQNFLPKVNSKVESIDLKEWFILMLCPFRTSKKLSTVPHGRKNCTTPRMWSVFSMLEPFRPGVSMITHFALLVIKATDISLVVFEHESVLLLIANPSTE